MINLPTLIRRKIQSYLDEYYLNIWSVKILELNNEYEFELMKVGLYQYMVGGHSYKRRINMLIA
jgi:hypothetical protein